MDNSSLLQDPEFLRRDQYRDSRNLGVRAQLHLRYSSNPEDWFKWVMAHLDLKLGFNVLECGCGPGWLWRSNLAGIPARCRTTLTDISPGMVAEAEETLATTSHDFRFAEADITQLPFDDQCFDVVIANHMLYHVPDRDKAFSEVQRVLKPSGRLFAATVGEQHMRELRDLQRRLMPELASVFQQSSRQFSLENGRNQLAPRFAEIKIVRYENRLFVTDVEPLLAYILSSTQMQKEVDTDRLHELRESIQQHTEKHGSFAITTDAGMFVAKNETI